MHFLIIGNGFDIAHNFPTKYTDFLSFCQNHNGNNLISEKEKLNTEFNYILENNLWLKYFLKLTGKFSGIKPGETWIDLEKEIAAVIQIIEANLWRMKIKCTADPSIPAIELDWGRDSNKFESFLSCFAKYDKDLKIYILSAENITDLDSFIKYLYVQLRQFTRAFEIYCLYINTISVKEPIIFTELGAQIKEARQQFDSYSEQLADAEKNNRENADEFKRLKYDASNIYRELMHRAHPVDFLSFGQFECVLSFNYTNTYERLYGDDKTQYCYIHGKAQEEPEYTNMILGIDDSLLAGEESKNFSCANFKKYYQRIIFKTGSEYKDWLHPSFGRLGNTNYVHIVGHSLDRTDHYVLYEFFSDQRFRIIVYYYNSADFEEKVQKVIQLLAKQGKNGRDELISRVHGKHWSIKFAWLYDENEGLFKKPSQSGAGTSEFESQ